MSDDRLFEDPNQDLVIKPTPSEFFAYRGPGSREMLWGRRYISGFIVPNADFYIHSRSLPPRLDLAAWQLQVGGGGVASPRTFTYKQIRDLPSVSLIRTTACGANGRSFFPRLPPQDPAGAEWGPVWGPAWQLGAVGTAEWTGVRLADVLKLTGLTENARFLSAEGLDEIRYRFVVPMEKALADDTLVVYAMNGEPLPIDHGFPVRLLFSNWGANSNVKWVGSVTVSEKPIPPGEFQEKQGLMGPAYPDPAPLTVTPVNSALEMDWEALIPEGPYLARGRSWSGHGRIARVEVSFDSGGSWWEATLREPNQPGAWVRWDLRVEARPGFGHVMVRATDEAGNTQPTEVPWNWHGLGFNGVVRHPVTVVKRWQEPGL